MLNLAEYKRRQAAPGVKVTLRNFGRDRRYPIINRFRDPGTPLPKPDETCQAPMTARRAGRSIFDRRRCAALRRPRDDCGAARSVCGTAIIAARMNVGPTSVERGPFGCRRRRAAAIRRRGRERSACGGVAAAVRLAGGALLRRRHRQCLCVRSVTTTSPGSSVVLVSIPIASAQLWPGRRHERWR